MSTLGYNLLSAVRHCISCDGKGCPDCRQTGLVVDIDAIIRAVRESARPEQSDGAASDPAKGSAGELGALADYIQERIDALLSYEAPMPERTRVDRKGFRVGLAHAYSDILAYIARAQTAKASDRGASGPPNTKMSDPEAK